ncbi:hypothetical protein HXX76_013470 [Chlamydomonas incerta]|uniref:Selenoprotein T n=1 Tax=Chlamydomonas incerta TaxID=51695 RepID=A0A835VUP5_CHLIN|nr:hypothetical protein HXX76_013470 [Chlamydomonas incerta]|eukprot:KAG2425846.1 hypothetical protein HXX76_013470 [Chlamydomonas incerta]
MRGAFVQVMELARRRYPGLEVVGTPYPLPAWKVPVVKALQGLQFGLLGMCLVGDKVFTALGVPVPAWYTQNVASNRFGAAMGVWFVGNMVVTNMQNTGAFEVFFNGDLIFSKLAEGRMPTVPELIGPMQAFFEGPAGLQVGGAGASRPGLTGAGMGHGPEL